MGIRLVPLKSKETPEIDRSSDPLFLKTENYQFHLALQCFLPTGQSSDAMLPLTLMPSINRKNKKNVPKNLGSKRTLGTTQKVPGSLGFLLGGNIAYVGALTNAL